MFAGNVQSTDVFDVVTAGAPIATGLGGTRVQVAGTYGSFEVQLANGNKTLRLANYQAGPVTFTRWAERHRLSGADAAWGADPNGNGHSNLLEYALGLDSNGFGQSGLAHGIVEAGGQRYLSLSYTRPGGAEAPTDLLYTPQRAPALSSSAWSSSAADVISLGVTGTVGPLEIVTFRSAHPISPTNPRNFLRLEVTLAEP